MTCIISFNFHNNTMKPYDYFCVLHIRKLWLTTVHHLPKVNPRLYDSKVPDSSRISPGSSNSLDPHNNAVVKHYCFPHFG